MSTLLPTDLEVERELALVRERVLEATRHVRSPRRSTRYRTTRTLIIAGAAVAILTAGAIVVAQVSQEQQETYVTCYDGASLDAQYTVFISAPDEAAPDLVLDPKGLCGIAWANDSFGNTSNNDPDDPNDGDAPVPPLVSCILPDGQTAVFPREGSTASETDFCGTLGLADWGSD